MFVGTPLCSRTSLRFESSIPVIMVWKQLVSWTLCNVIPNRWNNESLSILQSWMILVTVCDSKSFLSASTRARRNTELHCWPRSIRNTSLPVPGKPNEEEEECSKHRDTSSRDPQRHRSTPSQSKATRAFANDRACSTAALNRENAPPPPCPLSSTITAIFSLRKI